MTTALIPEDSDKTPMSQSKQSTTEQSNEFKQYRRKSISEMRRVIIGEDLSGISISEPDKKLMQDFPNIFAEGYIARNPKNHKDLWYVAKDYFEDNLETLTEHHLSSPVELSGEQIDQLESLLDHGYRPNYVNHIIKKLTEIINEPKK